MRNIFLLILFILLTFSRDKRFPQTVSHLKFGLMLLLQQLLTQIALYNFELFAA